MLIIQSPGLFKIRNNSIERKLWSEAVNYHLSPHVSILGRESKGWGGAGKTNLCALPFSLFSSPPFSIQDFPFYPLTPPQIWARGALNLDSVLEGLTQHKTNKPTNKQTKNTPHLCPGQDNIIEITTIVEHSNTLSNRTLK